MKKDMIEGLTPHFCRPDKDQQVLDQLRLTGKFRNDGRPDVILKLFVQRSQIILIAIEIEIGHEQIYRIAAKLSGSGLEIPTEITTFPVEKKCIWISPEL